jgi:hypothetical protein
MDREEKRLLEIILGNEYLIEEKEDQIQQMEDRIEREEDRIERELHQHLTIRIIKMSIGNVVAGSTGTFGLSLFLNGVADTIDPVSSTTWSSPDSTVTVEPAADGLSAVFTVPASDVATTLVANCVGTVTIVAGSPSTLDVGSTVSVSGSASVPVSPSTAPQTFTLQITQTA